MPENLRYLSTFERFLWLLDQVESAHFCVVAQIEGTTAVDEWHSALSAVQRRHPLLASSIQIDTDRMPYFRREPKLSIPLRVVEGNALEQMDAEIAREINTPFRNPDVSLVRAVLLHEKQRSVAILAAHHSITDGISLSHTFRDLLQAIAGQALLPLPTPPSHEELLGITDAARQTKAMGKAESSWEIAPLNPRLPVSTEVSSLRFSREFTHNLRARAREEMTTVHGALSASIVFAAKKLAVGKDKDFLRFGFPVSTRKVLDQSDEDCVLLTAGGNLNLEIPDNADFWKLARHVRSELAPSQMLERIIEERSQFHQIFKHVVDPKEAVQAARQALNAEFVLSNMGNFAIETHYGNLKLEALWGPAMLIGAFENQHMIGAATVNGSLTLVYSSHTPVAHLLETIKHTLMEVCIEQPA